ncbi:MAG: PAS domain S-box protein [Chloroflexi bacterium]|nr:PAS domain S-box protein [Chloroflexota bacterium]
MNRHLKLLIVEDSEIDASWVVRLLCKAGYDVAFERVETATAMQAALERQSWDLVIADYSQPQFDAPSALRLLQQAKLDIPFIVVSGVIGEEAAVEIMKAGAHDFVSKDNLARLIPAVARELCDAVIRRQHRQVEVALRESEEQYRLLAETTRDIILLHDMDGRIVYINQAGLDFTGFTRSQTINRSIAEFIPAEHLTGLAARQTHRTAGHEQADRYETEFINRAGERVPVEVNSTPVRRQGRVSGVLIVARDISERKRAEQQIRAHSQHLEERVAERTRQLQDAQEKLLRQERLAVLGRLAGAVAHELRNPLGVISNAIFYLKMVLPDAGTKVDEYLELIESEIHGANKIISNLLDFAHAQIVDREPVVVSHLLAQVLSQHPPPANVTVTTDIPGDLPPAFVDPHQIEQVLTNLVINAYQAMPEGGQLSVSCQQTSDESEMTDGRILITVTDTGTGISPEHMDKLFEPLFTTRERGIGLGLAISKQLVEANGGTIEVESTVGEGSTLTLRLPLRGNKGTCG